MRGSHVSVDTQYPQYTYNITAWGQQREIISQLPAKRSVCVPAAALCPYPHPHHYPDNSRGQENTKQVFTPTLDLAILHSLQKLSSMFSYSRMFCWFWPGG